LANATALPAGEGCAALSLVDRKMNFLHPIRMGIYKLYLKIYAYPLINHKTLKS